MQAQQLFVVRPGAVEGGCSSSRRIGSAVDIDPAEATVDDLRDAVEEQLGIPQDEQILVAGDRLLTAEASSSPSLLSSLLNTFGFNPSSSSFNRSPTLLELGVEAGNTVHVDRKVRGGGGVIGLLREVKGFYNPFIGLSYWFFPCALNVYGIYKFKHQNFWENKPVRDASAFTGERAPGGGDGH